MYKIMYFTCVSRIIQNWLHNQRIATVFTRRFVYVPSGDSCFIAVIHSDSFVIATCIYQVSIWKFWQQSSWYIALDTIWNHCMNTWMQKSCFRIKNYDVAIPHKFSKIRTSQIKPTYGNIMPIWNKLINHNGQLKHNG